MPFIQARIDVTKIDKSRIFEGKKGAKYIDLVMIETPNNRFGDDYMIVQGLPKAERDQGKRGPILGNAKYANANREQSDPTPATAPTKEQDTAKDADVPF